MNGKMKKLLALLLVLCLSLGCLAACGQSGSQTEPEVSTAEIDAIAEAASSLLPTHGSTEGKEETVYVIADAQGQPERTIVSAWLKNPEEADTINDRADLSNIQNVKGDESFTQAADGSLVWDAQGRDIYYQGDSDKELPLAVHVDYKLDGKEVTPEELEGASGHLEMTFSYENKASRQEKIGGKDVTVYQPFVAVSCLVLDASKASSVEVTNGTMINSGEQVIVAGVAMPGLKESLGLDELEDADGEKLDAEVPDTVTINADVTDFSLLTTVTLVENALLNDLDLEDVDSLDELKSSINKLTDASTQLVDGAGSLYDGTKTLSGGTDALTAGAVKLDAGARTIATNMGELYGGLVSLQEGATELNNGLSQLNEKVKVLPGSAASLQNGAETLKTALTEQIKEGAVKQLQGAANTIFETANTIQQNAGDAQSKLRILPAVPSDDEVNSAIGTLDSLKEQQPEQAAAIETIETLITTEQDSLKQAKSAMADAQDNVGIIYFYTSGIVQGAKSGKPETPGIYEGAAALAAGVDAMISGNEGNNLDTLIAGLGTLNDSSQALVDSVGQLSSGAATLEQGAGTAADGAKQLSDGANSLAAGAGELKNGSQSLSDGVLQVMNGASSLLDGLKTFDGDGVKVLSRLFEQDAQGFMDRLRAVQAYGEEYDNFSGLADGMPGMVRFIIRTDSIGE